MKKFFLFIVFLVAFVLLINGAKNEQAIFIFDGDYSVYGVNYSGEVGSKISLGCGEEVSCNKSEVEKVIKGFNEKIYGVTVKLANGKTIEEISEQLCNKYGFTVEEKALINNKIKPME